MRDLSALSCGTRLALVLLAGVFASFPASAGSELSPSSDAYFYDLLGPRTLVANPAELVVKVRATALRSDGARPAFLPARVTPADLPGAAVALESKLEARGVFVVRDADLASIRSLPNVEYALPVLYHGDSIVPIYPTNRIVLALAPGTAEADLLAAAEALGCDVEKCDRGVGRYRLTVRDPHSVSPVAIANALHERPQLAAYAHPDFHLPQVAYSPPIIQDPYYLSHQWHLDGDASKGAVAGSDIDVEVAWDTVHGPDAQGIPAVRVAILDECVEKWHPDLLPNWAAGRDYDVDPPDDDPSPDGGQRHGTSCAGVAVAAGNTIGVRGAAPNCGLIGVKFFGATISQMADSYYFCVDPDNNGDHSDGAAVLSNSWGFADGTLLPTDVVAGINFAANNGRNGKGALVLFAAANNDHTVNGVSALAQLPTVMAIGGTNSNNQHTEFSDVGPEVGLAAPTNDRGDDGVRQSWIDITTVDNAGSSGYNGLPDLDYTNQFGGTSSATPLAAGVLALIISQDPNMTAAQARAIAQHTAERVEAPYDRRDGTTGHGHRLGFGRVNAGAAVAAADAGIRWPDRIRTLTAQTTGSDINLSWTPPPNDYADSLLVRAPAPFEWMPSDGQEYTVGEVVTPGVEVIYRGAVSFFSEPNQPDGAYFYAVYPRSSANRYGFGAKSHVILNALPLFYDNCEGPSPAWTHGGAGDEWTRGTPTSANSIFGQSVVGSGPLAGTRGTRAINGDRCWGTDLLSRYNANCDAWLRTPLINLAGVTSGVYLEYWDWCLLETGYDRCRVEVLDAEGNLLGSVDDDTGGDYDWTRRVYDLSEFAGQPIHVQFRITSDDLLQRDGWFLDEIRVVVPGFQALPPVASNVYKETAMNSMVAVPLLASDPNPATALEYILTALPEHGSLTDPFAGAITSVPYTLAGNGQVVNYTPAAGYEGPDTFTYVAFDGALESNEATVSLSVGTPVPAYEFPLDSDPGWLRDPKWQFGYPLNRGGDPSAPYTGFAIFGYNLEGKYEANLPPKYLTTLPLNCSGLSRVTLEFARWLGVESGTYDTAAVEVSTDGRHWQPVWSNPNSNLEENQWTVVSYNIGAVADGEEFVQLRWVMGPTDAAEEFAGWNIDDVRVLGIGAPATNQPPLARALKVTAAAATPLAVALAGLDSDGDPLTYTIRALPPGGMLSEPDGTPIDSVPYALPPGAHVVTYTPDPQTVGFDAFSYGVDDGQLPSNEATVDVEIITPAPFPYTEDFEAGPPLDAYWKATSTGTGRIQVTGNYGPRGVYHLTMDSSYDGSRSANEATLAVDLEGHSFVRLEFDWKDFGEEADPLPDTWTGSVEGDGVAISADGLTWHKIADLFDSSALAGGGDEGPTLRGSTYQTVVVDLDQAIGAAGILYTKTFRIRFQQVDNYPIDTDGVAIDNIRLIQGTSDPLISTATLPTALLGMPYSEPLSVLGGDPPLVWSLLDTYGEEVLGGNEFVAGGVGQGWLGGNSVFEYTLPFAFPFYGQAYTQVLVGSDGWINFGPVFGSTYNNSTLLLTYNARIAVLWDNLRTDQPGNDVFVDESVPGQVTIRWAAVTHVGLFPCAFSCTLYADGRIRCHYGDGNTNLTPTIGVSAGDQVNYTLSSYDGAAALTGVASTEFDTSQLPPGLSLGSGGVVSGVPSAPGRYKPIFHVEDASGRTDERVVPILVVPELYGDADLDGDVDFDDFERLAECMDQVSPTPTCLDTFELNADGDINLVEFAEFQRGYTGP